MNCKNSSFLMLIFLFLSMNSCTTQKGATGSAAGDAVAEDMKTAALIGNILASEPRFSDLTIYSRIDADIDGNAVGLNGKIYISNKKKIWVNVSKFGLTAARAVITPDGFQAYEKLNRSYIDGDFSYFNDLLKVDFIDYQKLQNLMLGRVFTEMKAKDFDSEVIDNEYVLNYAKNDKIRKNPKKGEYIQTYKFDGAFRMTSAYLKDPKSGKELEIEYSDWIEIGTQYFPKYVKVLVKDKKTQKVELEYNSFAFEKSETPFNIPSGYKQRKNFLND